MTQAAPVFFSSAKIFRKVVRLKRAGQQMPSFRSMIPRRGVVLLRIRQAIMVVPSRARRNFAAFQPTL